jgi:His/Glu/Gln/Arg/opine family amino acid ABC transporter permease subunit
MRAFWLIWDYRDALLAGVGITIILSILSMAAAVPLGLFASLGTMSRFRPLRLVCFIFVEFCRNTPILVQLIWVHYALPDIIGIKFNAFTSSLIALTLQSSGYLAEEYRAGIESIERGQVEAAQSLGMTRRRLMWRIVLPQAVLRILPGILNQFVTCFKSTSIVSVIAVPDLMYQAGLIVSATYVAMPVYTFVAMVYFLLVLGVSSAVRVLARRLPTSGYFAEAGHAG